MKNRKNLIVNLVSVIFGVIMLLASINHIINPEIYTAMIPEFISPTFAHAFSIVTEGLIGFLFLIPKTRKYAAAGFTLLMIVFLPLHVWDVFRENHLDNPLVTTLTVAMVRLVIQFVLIAVGIWMFKVKQMTSKAMRK